MLHLVAARSKISLVNSCLVLPSVSMPRLLAAVMIGSCLISLVSRMGLMGVEVMPFAALSNSLLASPMAFAISGSFCGPQTNRAMSMKTIESASYPSIANSHHNCSHLGTPIKGVPRSLLTSTIAKNCSQHATWKILLQNVARSLRSN